VTTAVLDLTALQQRTVRVLVVGQILGGLGIGATLSIGAVLATAVSGSEAFAGAAATTSTLGAAAAAIPLARLAQRFGRRISLSVGTATAMAGALLTILAAGLMSFPLLLIGFGLLGFGGAVGLQSRFAATDVANADHRGRDLSIVVWSATVGAVVGPNLFGPGEVLAEWLRMPPLTGSFVIAVAAQLAAALVYFFALRPDPYLVSQELPSLSETEQVDGTVRNRTIVLFAIAVLAISHAVMVSVMSMTPVHLVHHGVSLVEIGLMLSLHIAGMFALSPVFGWLSDRLGRLAVILLGQLLFGLALSVIALGESSETFVTVGLIFLGLGWSASTVSASALLSDLLTGAARPKIQGRSDLVMNGAGALGGAAAGPVLALVGYSGLAWAAGVLVIAVTVGVVVSMARRRLRPAGPHTLPL
jgi:MFS family permease